MLVEVWHSGKGQSIRLPKGFRFRGKEVEIFRRGDEVVLREKEKTMRRALDLIASLPDDLDVPADGPPQERKGCKVESGIRDPSRIRPHAHAD